MAIAILDPLVPGGQGFKVADAADLSYSGDKDKANKTVKKSVEEKIQELEGLFNRETEIEVKTEKTEWAIGETPKVSVKISTGIPGQCTIVVKGDKFYQTLSAMPGEWVDISLKEVTTSGNAVYSFQGIDALGKSTEIKEITFALGGLELSVSIPSFGTQVFATNKPTTLGECSFALTAPFSQSLKLSIAVFSSEDKKIENAASFAYFDNENQIVTTTQFAVEGTELSRAGISIYINPEMNLPSGKYQLKILGEGSYEKEKENVTKTVESLYSFTVLEQNEIFFETLSDLTNFDTSSVVTISYKLSTSIENVSSLELKYVSPGATEAKTVYSTKNPLYSELYLGKLSASPDDGYTITVEVSVNYNENEKATSSFDFKIKVAQKDTNYSLPMNPVLNFVANANSINQKGQWIDADVDQNNYFFQLYNVSSGTNEHNGYQEDEQGEQYIRFSTESYGQFFYKTIGDNNTIVTKEYNPLNISGIYDTTSGKGAGYTVELYYRSKNLGENKAKVLTCQKQNTDNGFSIGYDNVIIMGTGSPAPLSRYLNENTWNHIALVYNPHDKDAIDEASTIKTYVNGCLVGCGVGGSTTSGATFPLLVNLGLDSDNNKFQGACDIKDFRFYKTALSSEQVLQTYKYVLFQHGLNDELQKVEKRNEGQTLPKIYLIRNQKPIINTAENNYLSFNELHGIKEKEGSEEGVHYSSNSCVNCTMWYEYYSGIDSTDRKIIKYPNVDVYLQGTSSLVYPVKNYQIKNYDSNSRGKEKPFAPPEKDGWEEDYSYTFKCDYMEQSHRNNTCTAEYYETVLKKVSEYVDGAGNGIDVSGAQEHTISPPKLENQNTAETENRTNYRDAITGFPIIVYYNENQYKTFDTTGKEIDKDLNSGAEYSESANFPSTYVGSYMFNIDKKGNQLGFKIGTANAKEVSFKSCYDYTADGEEILTDQVYEYRVYTAENTASPLTINQLPCISLEGATNIATSAATFFTLEESKETYENRYDYMSATLDPRYNYTKKLLTQDNYYIKRSDSNFVAVSKEALTNRLTYDWIDATINWFSRIDNLETDDAKREKFRNEFTTYFSFVYCLTYYLQMELFAQVDSAGKNAMFDSWGEVWYPRPYDMDTQMGLNNVGQDKVPVSVEMNSSFDLTSKNGAIVSEFTVPKDDERFKSFSVDTSRLWCFFAKYFNAEINFAYSHLRANGIYDETSVMDFVNALTSDTIGEDFYNKDAVAKYISQGASRYYACQGNRKGRYQQFLRQRLKYLDSKRNYNFNDMKLEARSQAYSYTGSSVIIPMGIQSYSPQYVEVNVEGKGSDKIYVSPENFYSFNGTTYEGGALVKIPIPAVDKNFTIAGIDNVKAFQGLSDFYFSSLNFEKAVKLNNLTLDPGRYLSSELTLGNLEYLKTLNLNELASTTSLDLSKTPNLQTLRVSNSAITTITFGENGMPLTRIELDNLLIPELTLKNMRGLERLKISNCPIETVYLENLTSLTELDLSVFKDTLKTVVLKNCPGLKLLNLAGCMLDRVELTNLAGLENLILYQAKGVGFSNLDLSSCGELRFLDVEQFGTAQYPPIIKLPRDCKVSSFYAKNSFIKTVYSETQEEKESVIQLQPTMLLEHFSFCENTLITEVVDLHFKDTPGYHLVLSSEDRNNNWIEDKSYNGQLSQAFNKATKLTKVVGKIYNCYSTRMLFDQCVNLENVEGLSFYYGDGVEIKYPDGTIVEEYKAPSQFSVSAMCRGCKKLTTKQANFLVAGTPYTYQASSAFGNCSALTEVPDLSNWPMLVSAYMLFYGSGIQEVPKNVFSGNKELTALYFCFWGCQSLTVVHPQAFSHLEKLNNVRGLFANCQNLETLFTETALTEDKTKEKLIQLNDIGELFHESVRKRRISNLTYLFYNCQKLQYPENITINGLFWPGLKLAGGIFFNNQQLKAIKTSVDKNLLDDCAETVVSIGGLFSHTGITALPVRLLMDGITAPRLVNASGLFEDCYYLSGNISSDLFSGCSGLKQLGFYHIGGTYNDEGEDESYYADDPSKKLWTKGAFANTKLTYNADFLSSCKSSLTDVSTLFAKGALCASGTTVPLSGTDCCRQEAPTFVPYTLLSKAKEQIPADNSPFVTGTVSALFSDCTALINMSYCFAGNQQIKSSKIDIIPNSVENASGLFLDTGLLDTGLEDEGFNGIFKNRPNLKNISGALGYTAISKAIASDIFEGSENIQDISKLFYGCKGFCSTNSIPKEPNIVPSKMLQPCAATLLNAEFLFADSNIYGYVPENLFANCEKLQSAQGVFSGCACLIGPIPFLFGNTDDHKTLSNLLTIKELFNGCERLGLYLGATEGDSASIAGGLDDGNLFPANWLNKCPNIADISYLFNNVGSLQAINSGVVNNPNIFAIFTAFPSTVFNQLTKVANAKFAFSGTNHLSLGNLSGAFLGNSLNNLKDVEGIFARGTNLSGGLLSVYSDDRGTIFERRSDSKNTVLMNMIGAFLGNVELKNQQKPALLNQFTALNAATYRGAYFFEKDYIENDYPIDAFKAPPWGAESVTWGSTILHDYLATLKTTPIFALRPEGV